MKTVLLSCCFFLSVLSVKAEDRDTVKVRQVDLNEVVVQSFKQNRDLRLEPLSASSVTGTAIQNKNITDIKEFSSFIPNLFMPDYGSKLTSPVYIRGIARMQLAVGTLQTFLDAYLKEHGGEVDYIHGDEVTDELGSKSGNIGFKLPAMGKEQLFKTVMADGVLPRKTFSMDHAQDKRYYVEARKIK